MTADFAARLRRNEPNRWKKPLARRADKDLPFDAAAIGRGALIVLDATVYIDALTGVLPTAIRELLVQGAVRHSAVARAELAAAIALLDPGDPRSAAVRRPIEAALARMRASHVVAPSSGVWAEAALLAGSLARLHGLEGDRRKRLLHDALILLTAREIGATVLSRNVADMDRLTQIRPDAKLLLYRV
jgi:predicted nucleic acid-binding protein